MRRLIALAMLLAAGPALAQQRIIPRSVLPGLGSADPRHTVARTEAPWASLGRVQLDIGGRCTGALVAPRLVLTAAHCLVAARSNTLVRPGTVNFLLGYHLGEWVAHARAVSYTLGPGFEAATRGPASADWALLVLDSAPPAPPLPLLREAPAPRTPLMLGGYQQDRPEVLLADTGCRSLGLSDRLLMHDCAGTRGSSGAPLLAQQPGGGWAVAGVASRTQVEVALGQAVPASALLLPR